MNRPTSAWWRYCAERYRRFFERSSVLDFGAQGEAESVRPFVTDPTSYTLVNRREGPGVDVVSPAHTAKLGGARAVVSSSMLEHDPDWEQSIPAMVRHVNLDGGLFMTWGGAFKIQESLDPEYAESFRPVPSSAVLTLLDGLGLWVHDFRYQCQIPGYDGPWLKAAERWANGFGEACVVAFREPRADTGPRQRMDTLPGD